MLNIRGKYNDNEKCGAKNTTTMKNVEQKR
jgi:hypothetical protein